MNWQTPERPPRKEKAEVPKGPKIVVQYRAKGGKVYEFKCAEAVVAVHIVQDAETVVPGGWRIDAATEFGRGPSVVEGRGATPAEALREVARAWTSHSPALAVFDWEAIARELHVVQAI